MSQQGASPRGHEDDWWRQLYDAAADDTGPTAAPDSLDDRFASAAGTVDAPGGPGPSAAPPAPPGVPAPRRAGTGPAPAPPDPGRFGFDPAGRRSAWRAPWEPPTAADTGPVTFPTAPPAPDPPRPAAGPPAPAPPTGTAPDAAPPDPRDYVGSGPPTYEAEPTVLPAADPETLGDLVPDTVLEGARTGTSTLRAASVRGDSARFRGDPRRDALLTARFGTGEQALVLVAMATGARGTPGAHRAAAELCRWIGRSVGRSHARLVADLRAARRGDLKSGLHRLTDRGLGRLRAGAAEQGLAPDEYTATVRCLLLPADPDCRTRVFFGTGTGGLFRLRDGSWQDIEPPAAEASGAPVAGFGSPPAETPEGDRLTLDLGVTTAPGPRPEPPAPPREPFRFRASVARPGDVLLLCTRGLADPLGGEADLRAHLAARWSGRTPPGLAGFLADTGTRVKGYADDRTAAAVWEA
ncbi:protein phosphatase 2C domain-containing protein [Streptomyces fumanus]|uniref:protein phosphatase 2C domain-containing protein n=1 Tax=Streptomyces fumanus TaxID=67302 RepID=UPI0033EAD5F3